MTDRDHFAAAALTGLLFHNYEPPKPVRWWTEQAYDYADAMLRERERVTESLPKEKRAEVSAAPVSRPAETRASGVARAQAWSCDLNRRVTSDEEQRIANHDAAPAAKDRTAGELGGARVTGESQEPVAWAVHSGDLRWLAWTKPADGLYEGPTVPLYRHPQPTLTADEREAILAMACYCDTRASLQHVKYSATLRALLERLA